MTNMFMVVFFLCQLLSIYRNYALSASALYKYTSTDLCSTTMPGTIRFRKEVGLNFMTEAMEEATDFIFKVFEQENISDRKNAMNSKFLAEVHDYFKDFDGYYFFNVTTKTHTLVLSAEIMANPSAGTLKDRVRELVFHEMTHAWQWYGNESSPTPPSMLFEGIAEYIPLMAGLKNYGGKKPGGGKKWDEGYEVTAFFLAYCNSLKPGFVAKLNKKMKYDYSDTYFRDLLGKPVEALWTDYKNKYRKENDKGEISRITDINIKYR